jgi:CDP-glucose 4,6-dehydratase
MSLSSLDSLRGARILVTGDTGFKGAWLATWLLKLGAEVAGFALPPEGSDSLFDRLDLASRIHHVDGDIRDAGAVAAMVREFAPDGICHLAAQSLVLRSYRDPKETFDTNVGGSVNVLEAVRTTPGVRALVFVTSDKCYLNREWEFGYREEDRLGGSDPYAASKAAAEILFDSYWQSFFAAREGFGAVSVRAGNVIGGGDWAENRIVPDCIRALKDQRPVVLRNPGAVRPWQHVLEPLSGYLMLLARLVEQPDSVSGPWNFGPAPSNMCPVRDLAERVVAGWGNGRIEEVVASDAPHETNVLYINSDKARRQLGWEPRWGFARTVDETVDWYRAVAGGEPAWDRTCQQIEKYLSTPVN